MAEEEKKEAKIVLFNIGQKFGFLTNGTMKPYYQANSFKPYSYSDIQELADKDVVFEIRPATPQEMNWSYKELGKYHYQNA